MSGAHVCTAILLRFFLQMLIEMFLLPWGSGSCVKLDAIDHARQTGEMR
jgi:hypothetical protein